MRLANIEIRVNSYTGIRVPSAAVHVNNGERGVYALEASVVEWRSADVLYTDGDYVVLSYDPDSENGIKLYDQIIIQERSCMMGKYIIDEERMKSVEENYRRILDNVMESAVKAGRNENDVRLMCVTKTVEPPYINKALELGADLIGENRVQEYLGKRMSLSSPVLKNTL